MTDRSGDDAGHDLDAGPIARLHRVGWSVGELVDRGDDGRPVWLVTGSNGENLVRAEGSTPAEAWSRAEDQARALGMLGRAGSVG